MKFKIGQTVHLKPWKLIVKTGGFMEYSISQDNWDDVYSNNPHTVTNVFFVSGLMQNEIALKDEVFVFLGRHFEEYEDKCMEIPDEMWDIK